MSKKSRYPWGSVQNAADAGLSAGLLVFVGSLATAGVLKILEMTATSLMEKNQEHVKTFPENGVD